MIIEINKLCKYSKDMKTKNICMNNNHADVKGKIKKNRKTCIMHTALNKAAIIYNSINIGRQSRCNYCIIQTALNKAANSSKYASIIYKSVNIGRQSRCNYLIVTVYLIHSNAFFYKTAKLCRYVR